MWESGNPRYAPMKNHPFQSPTLLVSKQLHAETLSLIKLFHPSQHSYELDVLLTNHDEIWPTSAPVPVLTTIVENMSGRFRIRGDIKRGSYVVSYINRDSPPLLGGLYELLGRFLKVGPVGRVKEETLDKEISIQTLDLDFLTQEKEADSMDVEDHERFLMSQNFGRESDKLTRRLKEIY